MSDPDFSDWLCTSVIRPLHSSLVLGSRESAPLHFLLAVSFDQFVFHPRGRFYAHIASRSFGILHE
jgi:hypothetical protein